MHLETLEPRRFFTAGTPDVRFGVDGIASAGASSGGEITFGQLIALPRGESIAVGSYLNQQTLLRLAVGKFTDAGVPAPGFEGGIAEFDDATLPLGEHAVVQGDGKILIAGIQNDAASLPHGAICRLNADRSLDTSFGTNGIVQTPTDPTGLALQADGKFLVCYDIDFDIAQIRNTYVARYNADGSPDTSWGNAGVLTLDKTVNGFGVDFADATDVAVTPDGKIIAAQNATGALIQRLNADGSADTTFGADHTGSVFINNTGLSDTDPLVLLHDGFIDVLGDGKNITRLDAAGTVVRSFSVELSAGGAARAGLAAQSDGKILVAGLGGLGRYNADGSADQTFGQLGIASGDFSAFSFLSAVTLGSDGNPLLGGSLTQPGQSFGVVRLWRDEGPAALLNLPSAVISQASASTFKLRITYRDDGSVKTSSLDDNDLQVRLPDGSTRKARLLSVSRSTNGGIRHAVYKFSAPGGAWDPADNGTYRVRLRGDQVLDTQHHASDARTLGTFRVNIASHSALPAALPAAAPTIESIAIEPMINREWKDLLPF